MTKKDFEKYGLKVTTNTKNSMLINATKKDYLIFVKESLEGFLCKKDSVHVFETMKVNEFIKNITSIIHYKK